MSLEAIEFVYVTGLILTSFYTAYAHAAWDAFETLFCRHTLANLPTYVVR